MGIIPACAGNTRYEHTDNSPPRDHPRVCGEHSVSLTFDVAPLGSSPRVRGTRRMCLARERNRGIIPACAGNTNPRQLKRFNARDHPRVCGEHGMPHTVILCGLGSSPRVRGTLPHGPGRADSRGIIPACAGNTQARCAHSAPARDHPRVCGEHVRAVGEHGFLEGSSPRVRGTLIKSR